MGLVELSDFDDQGRLGAVARFDELPGKGDWDH